jgi:glycosyltransferase involved in cell wall biosynthesis
VATIHDLAPFHVTGKYDWKRMFYGRVVVRRLAMRQDRVIAVSHNTAADLVRFFRLREAQIKVIHNGIDHRRFTPGSAPEAKARVAHRLGLTSPFFLYVARLEHPGKNHLRLIQAFEKFKNSCKSEFQLVFAGSDWHGAEAIHRAIQNSPHKKDIRSLGFVSLEELPELYRAAEVFVYPSLFEGFGFPPLEAMACGCPVISSTRGSLEEIVGTAALTVDPENVDEMSYQLRRGALDGALRARLRAAGIERALLFDWDVAAAETLKVYQQVAKTVPATRFVRGSEAPVR